MGLTIRFAQVARAAIERLPALDKKAMRAVLRLLASSPEAVRNHPKSIRERDVPDGMVLYTIVVGDWKAVLIIDENDLVVTDLVRWNQPAI